jgi:hypothetical protein
VRWLRRVGTKEARLGPLALERVLLRIEPAGSSSCWISGELVLLNQTAASLDEATLHLLLRDPEGRPLSTDWEALEPLVPGAQAVVSVRWSVPAGLALGSVSLTLSEAEPQRCSGVTDLSHAAPQAEPTNVGRVRLLGIRAAVEAPDDDGDQPLVWMAELDNPGPPLTEAELSLRALDAGGGVIHEEVLSAPPVLTGRQVLTFSGWCSEPVPVAALSWTLSLATPRRHGPVDLAWSSGALASGAGGSRGTLPR